MNEIRQHIEPPQKGGFVATSLDVPGLVAEGCTIVEATKIAHGLACEIAESCAVHSDAPAASLSALAQMVEGLSPQPGPKTDRAAHHDHYLYGSPKRP